MTTNNSSALVVRPYDRASAMLIRAAPALDVLLAPFGQSSDRMIRVVQDALARTPSLLECTPASIVRSAFHAAELGLELGTPLGHAYIVPYWNNKKRCREAQCIPGYQGLITLAYDEPRIVGIRADLVFEHDKFVERGGTHPALEHEPNRFAADRGALLGVYGAVQIANGWPVYRVLTKRDVDAVREASLKKMKEAWQRDASPWVTAEGEMQLKTALRRVLKWVPLGARLRRALELDAQENGEAPTDPNGHAAQIRQKLGDAVRVIDAEILEES